MDQDFVVGESSLSAVDRENGRCKVYWSKDDGGYLSVDMPDADATLLLKKLRNLYPGA